MKRTKIEHSRYVAAPLWLIALAAGAWPVASIILLIRRRRKRRRLALVGCCQHCGYDLRATATADGLLLPRCPECGAKPAKHGGFVGAEPISSRECLSDLQP